MTDASILQPSLPNADEFLSLFGPPKSLVVASKAVLHLHVLRVDAGNFAVDDMYTTLVNASVGYVLSRRSAAKVSDRKHMVEIINKVQKQFKQPDALNGEGGELLLYAFLEAHLGAPKILSKMELKTSPNDYVKGSDGVHLLQTDAEHFQLIFGESKMYADGKASPESSVPNAIRAAFKSMAKVRDDAFRFDSWLVQSELLKEAVSEEHVQALIDILVPRKDQATTTRTNAFGVFIGYEIDATDWRFIDMTDAEIEGLIIETAERLVEDQLTLIRDQIEKFGLGGHHFHLYAVPFLKVNVGGSVQGIEKIRIDLAKALRNDG